MNVLEQFERAMDIPKVNIDEIKISFLAEDSKLSFENDVLSFENDEINEDVTHAEYDPNDKKTGTSTATAAVVNEVTTSDLSPDTLEGVETWLKKIIQANVRNDITNYAKHIIKNLHNYTEDTLYDELEKVKNTYNGVMASRRRNR